MLHLVHPALPILPLHTQVSPRQVLRPPPKLSTRPSPATALARHPLLKHWPKLLPRPTVEAVATWQLPCLVRVCLLQPAAAELVGRLHWQRMCHTHAGETVSLLEGLAICRSQPVKPLTDASSAHKQHERSTLDEAQHTLLTDREPPPAYCCCCCCYCSGPSNCTRQGRGTGCCLLRGRQRCWSAKGEGYVKLAGAASKSKKNTIMAAVLTASRQNDGPPVWSNS